ncbi:hypothetical protein Y032_0418g1118 [Ancylostoma ceylanicum]|uniref:F-box domain-containing protein n=2 Tax=Ancylostoma ceylanicum TaxID=53326 RepID=A0A016X3A8_9BILA|nr:hypothetical protein Y032_0418g1118 [Ancylostoma ceylanicum]
MAYSSFRTVECYVQEVAANLSGLIVKLGFGSNSDSSPRMDDSPYINDISNISLLSPYYPMRQDCGDSPDQPVKDYKGPLQKHKKMRITPLTDDYNPRDNLSDQYLCEYEATLEKFSSNWNEHEQLDFIERILNRMSHNQLFFTHKLIQPMLQRDFIALLPQHLAEMILLNLDAQTLASCEAVSTKWRAVLAKGQLWRKVIERNVRTDNMWRGLSEKKKWRKFILVSRDCAAHEICDNYRVPYEMMRGSAEMVMLQHRFYRELFPKVVNDIAKIESNWRNGVYKLSSINCRSENSKGVYCLQYDDEKIVSGLRDNTIKVWNRQDLSCERVLSGHTGSVLCLQYDERVIISGSSDATVRVWDVATGECLNTLIHHCEAVLHLRFNDGIMVTCSKDRSIAVWDMVSPREINLRRVLVGHRAAVNVVDFDDRYIVSASGDRTIKVWSADSLEFVRTLSGHKRGIACLQYRGRLVVSGSSDNSIRLWDIHSGVCLRVLEGHEELVRCIRFDDKRIVSGAYDGKIRVWDLEAALDPRSSPSSLCLSTLVQHTGRVFRLQFDDFQIVSSSHDDTILIWDFLVEPAAQSSGASPPSSTQDDPAPPTALPSSSAERTIATDGACSPPQSPPREDDSCGQAGPSTSYSNRYEGWSGENGSVRYVQKPIFPRLYTGFEDGIREEGAALANNREEPRSLEVIQMDSSSDEEEADAAAPGPSNRRGRAPPASPEPFDKGA